MSEVDVSARAMRAARTLAGLSQKQLAVQARVTVNTVRLFEGGKRKPRPRTLASLREALARNGVSFLPPSDGRVAGIVLSA